MPSRLRRDTSSRAWRDLRTYVLNRDGWRCRIGLAGCSGHATEADHIEPVDEGGAYYDPANLRAACKSCNSKRGNALRRQRAQRFTYRTTTPPIDTRL